MGYTNSKSAVSRTELGVLSGGIQGRMLVDKWVEEARVMGSEVKSETPLIEDPSLVSSTHTVGITTVCNFSSRESDVSGFDRH